MSEVTNIFENVLLKKERIQNNPDDPYEDILDIIDIIKTNNSNLLIV